METYVCLLIDTERNIVGVDAFAAESDSAAREKAAANKSANPLAKAYELWRMGKKVATGGTLD